MARFRCPDTSDDALVSPSPKQSVAKPTMSPQKRMSPRAKGKEKARLKRRISEPELQVLARRSRKSRQVQQGRTERTVWVGNLPDDVKQEQLSDIFDSCGRIVEVSIRCAGGYVGPIPKDSHARPYFGGSSRNYASIVFYRSRFAAEAMKLNGRKLHGKELVVCRFVYELPEFQKRAQDYIDRQTQDPPSLIERTWESVRRRTVDRTHVAIDFKPAKGSSAPEEPMPDVRTWIKAKMKYYYGS